MLSDGKCADQSVRIRRHVCQFDIHIQDLFSHDESISSHLSLCNIFYFIYTFLEQLCDQELTKAQTGDQEMLVGAGNVTIKGNIPINGIARKRLKTQTPTNQRERNWGEITRSLFLCKVTAELGRVQKTKSKSRIKQ